MLGTGFDDPALFATFDDKDVTTMREALLMAMVRCRSRPWTTPTHPPHPGTSPATWPARGGAHPGHHGDGGGPGCVYHSDARGRPDPLPFAGYCTAYTRRERDDDLRRLYLPALR